MSVVHLLSVVYVSALKSAGCSGQLAKQVTVFLA